MINSTIDNFAVTGRFVIKCGCVELTCAAGSTEYGVIESVDELMIRDILSSYSVDSFVSEVFP